MCATQVGTIRAAVWKSTSVAVKVRSNRLRNHKQHEGCHSAARHRHHILPRSANAQGTALTLRLALRTDGDGMQASLSSVTARFSPTGPGNCVAEIEDSRPLPKRAQTESRGLQ